MRESKHREQVELASGVGKLAHTNRVHGERMKEMGLERFSYRYKRCGIIIWVDRLPMRNEFWISITIRNKRKYKGILYNRQSIHLEH